jgi:hypothetical protein
MTELTVPPKACTAVVIASITGCSRATATSGSTSVIRLVDPTVSANSSVTSLRAPDTAGGVADAAATGVPHDAQKRSPGRTAAPQLGHMA